MDAVWSITRRESGRPIWIKGVTGSGKTEVYMELDREDAEGGAAGHRADPGNRADLSDGAAVLPPVWNRISILHSRLSPGAFRSVPYGRKKGIEVMIGPRSAPFTRLNLGLIMIDEEHETSV